MPVGKNSIKRVANNGYSNVKTEAPDMENSSIVEKSDAAPEPKVEKKAKKKPAAKAAAGKKRADKVKEVESPKPSYESDPSLAPLATLDKITEADQTENDTRGYTNVGREMPVHLL